MATCYRKMDGPDLLASVIDEDITAMLKVQQEAENRWKRLTEELNRVEDDLYTVNKNIKQWMKEARDECDCGCQKEEAA